MCPERWRAQGLRAQRSSRLGTTSQPHGIFATRSPARPNPIGLSTVRLLAISGSTIEIEDVDVVDGTPLLDIKPYVPAFDDRDDVRVGWFATRLGGLVVDCMP
jgi:tRNA (Thr-GGU) A37 N-methylase